MTSDSAPGRKQRLLRIIRDPLFLFCLLGTGTFIVFEIFSQDREVILMTDTIRESLEADFQTLEGYAPGPAESEALRDRHIRDEILFREALERGLHLNDSRLRRVLIDKMRFMLASAPEEPSERELIEFYTDNLDRYYHERRLSFYNLFFNEAPDKPAVLLESLRQGAEPEGDETFWLGGTVSDYHESVVQNVLGRQFTDVLNQLDAGEWAGPIQSNRGYHFVRLDAVRPPEPRGYQDVREQVRQDWSIARQEASINERVDEIANAYTIREITQ